MFEAPEAKILCYLIASTAPCCENPASVVSAHCECRPATENMLRYTLSLVPWGSITVLFLFLLNSYHFIVIVETKEPLEIFPICLKHSELQDDKCAILIDFFGAYFWSSGCSQFRQRATKGRHMATKGAMMGSSGIIMANGRPRVVTGFNT